MSAIVEFLKARIAEDEARAARDSAQMPTIAFGDIILPASLVTGLHDPARQAAECKAKRFLMSQIRDMEDRIDSEWGTGNGTADEDMDGIRALAAIYSDHPDYRQEWAD